MANDYVFNDQLPVASLKIAALESCRELAGKVNDHIVGFRRNDIQELIRRKADLHYRGYDVDSYLLKCECPRLRSKRHYQGICPGHGRICDGRRHQ